MAEKKVSTLRIISAAILDFFTVFIVAGYAVAKFTGGTTNDGFSLNGLPALVVFALIVVYFIVMSRTSGGTIWQRILKAKR